MPQESPHWGYFSDLYKFGPSGTTFSPEVTLTISYADEDVSLVGEDCLRLFKYNATTMVWEPLATTIDKGKKQASAKIATLGTYALSGHYLTPDTTPPTIAITSPDSGDTLSGFEAIAANITDDHGVYRAAFYLGDIFLGEDVNTADGIALLADFSKYAMGSHVLRVTAEDASGNTAEKRLPVNISSIVKPVLVSIKKPSAGQSVETSVTVEGTVTDSAVRVVATVDDVPAADVVVTTPGAFSFDLDTSYLPEGGHALKVYAFDIAANSSSDTASFTVAADTEAPMTAIISHPDATTSQRDARFTFTGTDNRTSTGDLLYMVKLEGIDTTYTVDSTTTANYRNLPDGAYAFKVKAVDWAGNIDQSEARFSFTVRANTGGGGGSGGSGGGGGSTPPAPTKPAPPTGLKANTNDTMVHLVWSPSKAEDIAGYKVYRKDKASGKVELLTTAPIKEVQYQDKDAKENTVYSYWVVAVDKKGTESEKSNEVEAVRAKKKAAVMFLDIAANAWYKSFVDQLIERNIIGGYSDGTFKPDKTITRAEFAKMVCLAQGWELINPATQSFKDVPKTNWAYSYIETAKTNGALGGYKDGTFKADKNISRAEIAKIVSGALKLPEGTSTLKDISAHWAKGYIGACANAGIVSGYLDGTFKPNATAKRSEAAKMIAGMFGAKR